MCGIAGMVVRDGLGADDLREVAQLGDLMARRGPDDAGHWDDGVAAAFAFRRLAIIDLSERGHQPMASPDGEHVLVYNGELYNHLALRAELERAGHRFRSDCDAEVVLLALAEWGTDALRRFNGMFAISWYRPASRTLVLARDPLGIKPLLYWWSPEAFVFGSQYDQVVRHRRCRRERVDPKALALFLRLGYLPAPHALIERTGQVEPGHYVELTPGAALASRPFHHRAPVAPPSQRLRGRAADDAVDELVHTAVSRQLVSDVQVGTFLSGGVDSPLVTAHMGRPADGRPVPAFTIGTDDAATDESSAAAALATALEVEHHVRHIDGPGALALLGDVARANTEPFGDYSSFPTLLVSELAASHVKVVLSGDGGDELFWGYPRFAKLAKARKWFGLPRVARVGAYAASKPLPTARRPARGVLFPDLGSWYLDAHSGLRTGDLDAISPGIGALPDGFDTFRLETVPDEDGLLQWMRANELACHLPMILQKVDRASMYHSLEVRVPLLDVDLLDLSMAVDPSACIERGVGKGVLRRSLARHVPAEAIAVPKRGFTVPLGRWLGEELAPTFRALLLDRDPFPAGTFDRGGLEALYADHVAGRRTNTRGLWHLLALQLWADEHLRPLPAA